jgi:hypothetical protein
MQVQKGFGSDCEKQQQPRAYDLMWTFPCKLLKDLYQINGS